MSTNFYAKEDSTDSIVHIGKSAHGWCFYLRVHPHLQTIKDWAEFLKKPGISIANEYGDVLTPTEMLGIITLRSGKVTPPVWEMDQKTFSSIFGKWYTTPENFMKMNSAVPGPNGLLRLRESVYVRHGEGTWDYCNYEFC